jgi:hypothetical protein
MQRQLLIVAILILGSHARATDLVAQPTQRQVIANDNTMF